MGFEQDRSWKGHKGSLAQSPYLTEGETEAQRGVATVEGHTRVSVELGTGPGPPDSQAGPSLLAGLGPCLRPISGQGSACTAGARPLGPPGRTKGARRTAPRAHPAPGTPPETAVMMILSILWLFDFTNVCGLCSG